MLALFPCQLHAGLLRVGADDGRGSRRWRARRLGRLARGNEHSHHKDKTTRWNQPGVHGVSYLVGDGAGVVAGLGVGVGTRERSFHGLSL